MPHQRKALARVAFGWLLTLPVSATSADAAIKYTFEHGPSLSDLPYQISTDDLINGLPAGSILLNPDLAANWPFNTNGYKPISNMIDPCATTPALSADANRNPGISGFHPASGDPAATKLKLVDGLEGANVDSALADFAWPAAVFQFDLPVASDIGEIRVFAANSDTDGRVFQNYDVEISIDPNIDTKERIFSTLIKRVITSSVVCAPDGFDPSENPDPPNAIGATVTRVFDDANPILASNVTSVRFTFWAVSNNAKAFWDQWLGRNALSEPPCGLVIPIEDAVDAEDADGHKRAFQASIIKEIDILAVRTGAFEICDNIIDDDGDTLVDGNDRDCFRLTCPQEPAPLAWWRFEEGMGTMAHDSGPYSLNGQIHNATWVPGAVGQALYFDGIDDSYVEVPDNSLLSPRTHLVIEAHIKPESYPTWHMAIIFKGDLQQTGCFGERSYSLWATASGGLHFTSTPTGENCQLRYDTAPGIIPTGVWSRVKVDLSTEEGKVLLFVNDVPVLEGGYPNTPIRVGNSPLRIGGMFRSNTDQSNFRGAIDEVRLYCDAVPPQQWVYNSAFLTDAQMEQYGTMSVEQVGAFLAAYNSYFRQPVADVDGVVFDMAATVVGAANQCQINPQVLLTTLQKESVAVTTPSRPSPTRMSLLMGAGAPSTAREQVYEAARLYRAYLDELDANGATRTGWRVGVGKTTLDGAFVTPATRAVAALFTYTPYAGAQWGGNQPQWGGTYLFHHYWSVFGFGSALPSLPAPTGLAASAVSDSAIALAWDDQPGAAGYRLERKDGPSGGWVTRASPAAGTTAYQDTGLSSNTTYYYRLANSWAEGLSPYSRTVTASPADALTPHISRITPGTPIATGDPQPVTIYGQNFHPEAAVSLRRLGSEPSTVPANLNGAEIVFDATFDVPGAWAVAVTNPGEKRAEYTFNVSAVEQGSAELRAFDWDTFKTEFEQVLATSLGQRTYPQIGEGLDETRNYGTTAQDLVQSYLTQKSFLHEPGIQQLLHFVENDPGLSLNNEHHLRWVAYMLATVRQETARVWHPLQELGQGNWWHYFEYEAGGTGYGGRQDLGNGPQGEGDGFRYRGRGYVQITGKANYAKFTFNVNGPPGNVKFQAYLNSLRRGLGTPTLDTLDLVANPNLTLEPQTAYAIMSYGMRNGSFTGHSLKDWIPADADPDYLNARRIVSGDQDAVGRRLEQWAHALHYVLEKSRLFVQNGRFAGASLAGWSGPGSGIDVLQGQAGNHFVRLIAQSPVSLSQIVVTPAELFELHLDYQFTTATGTVDILLDSALVATLASPDSPQAEPEPFTMLVSDSELLGREDVVLAFRVDGPAGSEFLLSNIEIAAAVPPVPSIIVPADLDGDGDVDADDFAVFAACAAGPAVAHEAGQACPAADFDGDGDVDQADFAVFQRCYSGEGNPADPNCAN